MLLARTKMTPAEVAATLADGLLTESEAEASLIRPRLHRLDLADLRSLRATINALLSHQEGAARKLPPGKPDPRD